MFDGHDTTSSGKLAITLRTLENDLLINYLKVYRGRFITWRNILNSFTSPSVALVLLFTSLSTIIDILCESALF